LTSLKRLVRDKPPGAPSSSASPDEPPRYRTTW
jgi:hypothetical protein